MPCILQEKFHVLLYVRNCQRSFGDHGLFGKSASVCAASQQISFSRCCNRQYRYTTFAKTGCMIRTKVRYVVLSYVLISLFHSFPLFSSYLLRYSAKHFSIGPRSLNASRDLQDGPLEHHRL